MSYTLIWNPLKWAPPLKKLHGDSALRLQPNGKHNLPDDKGNRMKVVWQPNEGFVPEFSKKLTQIDQPIQKVFEGLFSPGAQARLQQQDAESRAEFEKKQQERLAKLAVSPRLHMTQERIKNPVYTGIQSVKNYNKLSNNRKIFL